MHSIISPNKCLYKKYYVKVEKPMKDPTILERSIEIKDGKGMLYTPKTAYTEKIDDHTFYLYIAEGKFHQVKRMVEYFGNTVEYLKRVQIGDIILDESLALGEYKEI